MKDTDLSALISNFTVQIVQVVEKAASERIKEALAGAFTQPRRGPGRPPKHPALAAVADLMPRIRRKGPKQLCPVPGCKNPAAPVFGMVCAKHKDVPKAKIKEYRAKRRLAKSKGKSTVKKAA